MSNLVSFMGLGARNREVELLSTASTALALTYEQQEKLLVWAGQAGAARLTLPQGEPGMAYNVFFTADAVSSATKILTPDTSDFYVVDGTTDRGIACASTVEGGLGISVYCINTNRWVADRFGASTLAIGSASS